MNARKIFLFFLLLTSGFFIICHIQGSTSNAEEPAAGDLLQQNAAAEEDVVEKGQDKVTAIEVRGNKSISSNIIISKMKTRIGSTLSENVISDDLKRLYLLGYFSDINIDTEPYKDGVKLIIEVTEKLIIESISISGITRYRHLKEKIQDTIKSKKGQYLDYPTLREDTEAIKELYGKKGFIDTDVKYEVKTDEKTNKAKVKFRINEGHRVSIKFISFVGNKTFSYKRLMKIIKTRPAWLFGAGILRDEVLEEDMERLRSFYRREGFPDVKVDYTVDFGTYRRAVFVTITIDEGKRYFVGSIKIKGNRVFSDDEIMQKLESCLPGKVYNEEAKQRDVMRIQGMYFDKGYIFAKVRDVSAIDEETGKVNITYNIIENEVAYVRRINIRGNVKTKDVVIRRELRIKPGDRFDGEKLRRSKERLHNLGFFEEISYDTEPTDEPNKRDLVVEVKEAKTGSFSFGGGYSTAEEFVGFIEIEQKNFDWRNFPYFTGAGQDLRVRAEMGTITNLFDLSFTEPWLFDYPVSFGFDVYKTEQDRESDVGYGYDQKKKGGRLRLGREFSEYLRGNVIYRIDMIDLTDVTPNATADLKTEEGKNTISSVAFGLTRDTRDSVFEPTRGYVLAETFEVAGGAFGGDKDFMKLIARGSKYFPLPLKAVLEFRLRVGIADAYGDSEKIPIYERFFAGGANSIRGYNERKVGPIDTVSEDPLGGEALLVGNVEYLYPLSDFLKAAAFYDIGNVWQKVGHIGRGEFKSSVGLGLRIKTPIGPIKLDYGYPLSVEAGEEDKEGKFHFSISHGF